MRSKLSQTSDESGDNDSSDGDLFGATNSTFVAQGGDDNDNSNDDDDEDDENDDENDDYPEDGNEAFEDPGFWPPEAIAVLQEHKEKWVEGDRTDRRVGLAVQALVDAGHGKRHNLKKTVKKWLQRRSTMTSKFGPNRKPTLRTVIAFYEAERIAREVEEEIKRSRTWDQKKRIGIYSRVVSKVMQEVLCDADSGRLEEMEERQDRWSRRGPPRRIQRQCVTKF